MYSTSDFKRGLKLMMDKHPYIVMEFQHVKPGKGPAFVRSKLKNLITGKILTKTFRSGEKFEEADVETRTMEYLYFDGSDYVVMDSGTYEQYNISEAVVGDDEKWMQENAAIIVLLFKGNPVNIEVPQFLNLEITRSDPGIKGNTAQGGTKPATLSTGATIQVPLFVEEGEVIKVDTTTGSYIERVKQ